MIESQRLPQEQVAPWLMANSFENVRDQAVREAEKGGNDRSWLLRNLNSRQRRALTLFETSREITARDVARVVRL